MTSPLRAIILDTETTEIENPEVIELAWKGIGDDLLLTDDQFYSLYSPSKPSSLGAQAVHHILPIDLEGKPPSSEARIPPNLTFIIGHNIDFDWKALGSPQVKRICTLALARRVWPDLDSHSQSALMYYLFGANAETKALLRNAHSAVDDIGFCYRILQAILLDLRTPNLDTLWVQSEEARIPLKMTFGKWKGSLIKDVDRGYALWYSRQSDTDPYLLEAFRRAKLLK